MRRRRWPRRVSFALTALVLLGIAGLWWQVRDVEVSGGRIVPNAAVRDAVLAALQGKRWGVLPRTSRLLYGRSALEESIRKRFALAEVAVRLRHGGVLSVTVREQQIAAVVRIPSGEAALLSESGQIIGPAPAPLSSALIPETVVLEWPDGPLLTGGALLSPDGVAAIRTVWGELVRSGDPLTPRTAAPRVGSMTTFDIHTSGGAVVSITIAGDTARQLTKLQAVLRERIGAEERARIRSVDLRYGDRVYLQ